MGPVRETKLTLRFSGDDLLIAAALTEIQRPLLAWKVDAQTAGSPSSAADPTADLKLPTLAVAIAEMNVFRMVRLGLLAAVIPMSVLSLAVLAYLLFNFDFWFANVTAQAKLLEAATVLLTVAMCYMLRQGIWTIQQVWTAAFILLLSLVELAYVMPVIFEGLGRF